MDSIAIRPCVASDGPAIGHSNVAAFWTDATWVALWPGRSAAYVAEQSARRMANSLLLDRAHRRHLKAIDTTTGTVVGYARWRFPAEMPDEECAGLWPEAQVPAVADAEQASYESEFHAADWAFDHALDVLDPRMLEMKDRRMRGRRFLLLDYLAVRPDYRGYGIGTALAKAGLLEAEKLGMDSCVLGMRAGLGVYQRAGYTLVEEVVQDASRFGGDKEYGAYFLETSIAKA